MADNPLADVLRADIEDTDNYFRFTWSAYLSWYTVFITLNLTAIAFVEKVMSPHTLKVVALVFLGFNLLGIVTSYLIGQYTKSVATSRRKAREDLVSAHFHDRPADEITSRLVSGSGPVVPISLAHWSAWANLSALVLFGIVWFYLLLHGTFKGSFFD